MPLDIYVSHQDRIQARQIALARSWPLSPPAPRPLAGEASRVNRAVRTVILVVGACGLFLAAATAAEPIALRCDEQAGQLTVTLDGREAIVYQFADTLDMPHLFPLRSPSGKSMTIQHAEDHPHHRSVWFADAVQLPAGQPVSFYTGIYSRVDKNDPNSPLGTRIRHVKFLAEDVGPKQATVTAQLIWETDEGKTPMADQTQTMRIVPLGDGEYLLDMTYKVVAAYGDVTFTSDAVHYAWPYVRVTPEFSVAQGGTVTDSEGRINEQQSHDQPSHWVDYTNTIDGKAEGVAMLLPIPPSEPAPRWLVRNYGCFGPRRFDEKSGKPFTLKKGEAMEQRVGILVHSGDVRRGRVRERYEQYVGGTL